MAFLKETVYMGKKGNEDSDDEQNETDREIATELQKDEDARLAEQMSSGNSSDRLQRIMDQAQMLNISNIYTNSVRRDGDGELTERDENVPDGEEENDYEDSNVNHRSEQREEMVCSRLQDYTNINNEILKTSDGKLAQEVNDRQMAYQMQVQADEELAKQLQGYPENTADGYKMKFPRGAKLMMAQNVHGQKMFYVACGRPDCPDCAARERYKREQREREAREAANPGGAGVNGHSPNGQEMSNDHGGAAGNVGVAQRVPGSNRQPAAGKTKSYPQGQPNQREMRSPEERRRNNEAGRGAARGGHGEHRENPARGGARPRLVFMVQPRARRPRPRAGMDLLRDGSQVQGAFSRDEWAGIRRDPFRLIDVLGDRRAAARRMERADIDGADYESLWELAERLGEVKKRGLDPREIDLMPTVKYEGEASAGAENNDKETCKICLSEFASGDRLRTLPCLHQFHQKCIDQWIKSNAVCPICRIEVKEALKGNPSGPH